MVCLLGLGLVNPITSSNIYAEEVENHTYKIRNYVGKNLATIGYESLGGDYRDEYGDCSIKILLQTEDGSYIDYTKKSELKKYTVTAQSVKANTVINVEYMKDEDGEEDEDLGLVEWQSIECITLSVKKRMGSNYKPKLIEINNSSDKTKNYIRNYVGLNAAYIGYESLGGEYRDAYGDGSIELTLNTKDGEYIDVTTKEGKKQLKKYKVVEQSIDPNTEFDYVYNANVDSFVESQSLEQIDLTLEKIK